MQVNITIRIGQKACKTPTSPKVEYFDNEG